MSGEALCSGCCPWRSTPAKSRHLHYSERTAEVNALITGLVHPEVSLGEIEEHS